MKIETIKDFRAALEADTMGYGLVFYTKDGGILCENCANDERELIEAAISDQMDDGWFVVGAESGDMFESGERCDHCNLWLDQYHIPFEAGAHLIANGAHGVYIPQIFATDFDHWKGASEENLAILREGPEHEYYWDAWIEVLDRAYYVRKDGKKYTLYQNDDLWAIEEDTWIGDGV